MVADEQHVGGRRVRMPSSVIAVTVSEPWPGLSSLNLFSSSPSFRYSLQRRQLLLVLLSGFFELELRGFPQVAIDLVVGAGRHVLPAVVDPAVQRRPLLLRLEERLPGVGQVPLLLVLDRFVLGTGSTMRLALGANVLRRLLPLGLRLLILDLLRRDRGRECR